MYCDGEQPAQFYLITDLHAMNICSIIMASNTACYQKSEYMKLRPKLIFDIDARRELYTDNVEDISDNID
jgi:hypothetical protein